MLAFMADDDHDRLGKLAFLSSRRYFWSRQIQEFECGLDSRRRRGQCPWPTSFYRTPGPHRVETLDIISWLAVCRCKIIVGRAIEVQRAFLTIATQLGVMIYLAPV